VVGGLISFLQSTDLDLLLTSDSLQDVSSVSALGIISSHTGDQC
jgi:hypothetical protein